MCIRDSINTALHITLQIVASLSVLLEPFLPFSAAQLCRWLDHETDWADAGAPVLRVGTPLAAAGVLFKKIEDVQVETQIAKLGA